MTFHSRRRIVTWRPEKIRAMNLVEETMLLSERAGEIFSHLVEILCGLRSLVQPDVAGGISISTQSTTQAVADLQQLHEKEQEAFRSRLAVAQVILSSFHSEDQTTSTFVK